MSILKNWLLLWIEFLTQNRCIGYRRYNLQNLQRQALNDKSHFLRRRLRSIHVLITCRNANQGVTIPTEETLFDQVDLHLITPRTAILTHVGTTRFLAQKQDIVGSYVCSIVPRKPFSREKFSLVSIKDVGY